MSQIIILVLIISIIIGEGVPYNVSVTPVNITSPGSITIVTLFTSKYYNIVTIIIVILFDVANIISVPSSAPNITEQ